jgi:hypothetical protein
MSNRANEYTSDRKFHQNNPYIQFKLGKINLKDIPYDSDTGIYSIVLALADVGKTPLTHIDESTDPTNIRVNFDNNHESSSDSYYIYRKNLDHENNKNDSMHYYAVKNKKISYLYFVNFKVEKKVDVNKKIICNT